MNRASREYRSVRLALRTQAAVHKYHFQAL